ncbi:MAG: helicase-related protein, partial [Pseudomonadota bacterium]|nr:helicase-related protein [Pseudomonadota bacterium]
LHNISSSVVILDEVQTTPLPVLFPCMLALQELARNYRTSIVLCTATQPALGANKIKHGFANVRELAPEQDAMFKFFKRVNIQNKVEKWSDDELLEQIKSKSQVLCIVNNRQHALFLANKLQADNTTGVRLLTTYMYPAHRRKVLEAVRQDLKDNKDCRLVATSLVEAGVDLDFACVLRAVAGLDSIAQAAGRCNREGKRPVAESNVIIFGNNPDWEPPLELKQFAQEAEEVLRSDVDLLSKEAITSYFSSLYWTKGDDQLDAEGILQTLKDSKLKSLPFEKIENDFKMIKNLQRQIIIPYDDNAKDLIKRLRNEEQCSGVARQLQAYCISLPQCVYKQLLGNEKLETIAEEKFAEQFVQLNYPSLYDENFGFDCSGR